ncbi:hypothetical protein MHH60_31970 [Paenibacillus sp. FSL H7-0716]|uniref:hypothetical protein n=1 Tax=Paenibacillus TaxID=44249 RepID=UPI0011816CFA|nr:hypothetical protein [Paenibacillus odorifer]
MSSPLEINLLSGNIPGVIAAFEQHRAITFDTEYFLAFIKSRLRNEQVLAAAEDNQSGCQFILIVQLHIHDCRNSFRNNKKPPNNERLLLVYVRFLMNK